MNSSNSVGETSCKRQENGDGPSETERPLKKARFAWQIKGKYHLKNELDSRKNGQSSSVEAEHTSPLSSDMESEPHSLGVTTEKNLEILGDYLLKQDFNTLGSVINESNNTMLTPCVDVSTNNLHYPRYVASFDNNSSHSSTYTEISATSSSSVMSEDQCIARWQAKQISKGFIDNTINRVLDSWMSTPLPNEIANDRLVALDVAEFINNMPDNNSVENEGILMAISAHGLQNASSSENSNVHNDDDHFKNNIFPSPPSSPLSSDEEYVPFSNCRLHRTKQSVKEPSPWDCWDNSHTCDTLPNLHKISTENVLPFHHNDAENKSDDVNRTDSNSEDLFDDHFKFMEVAVGFAIQSKGLNSYGSELG